MKTDGLNHPADAASDRARLDGTLDRAKLDGTLDRANSDVVLIVDDVPDNLSVLHDALDESGYTVLVATHGEAALQRAAQVLPDIILLDAMMPGMDGFEVAKRLKALPQTAHIPIIFMTGLTETEYLVAALEAGGIDYVTKPIKPKEVLARMNVHLQGARRARQEVRQAGQARSALDAFGYASITVRASDGRLMWQTPLARDLLNEYFGATEPPKANFAPQPVVDWLHRHLADAERQVEPPRLSVSLGPKRLSFRLHQQTGDGEGTDWLIIMREVSDAAAIEAMRLFFKLTAREAEVLYWVVKGKTNRDIGEILGSSPATAKKHLERIYVKLGVETRTAAAGMAMGRIRQLHPEFEG
jgi:DNA-binding response OmpR family regulator/DNA-binding CsgD family transcriptional regulator